MQYWCHSAFCVSCVDSACMVVLLAGQLHNYVPSKLVSVVFIKHAITAGEQQLCVCVCDVHISHRSRICHTVWYQ